MKWVLSLLRGGLCSGILQFELLTPLILTPVLPQMLEVVAPPIQGVELILGLNQGIWDEAGPEGVASPCRRFVASIEPWVLQCFRNRATGSPFGPWKKLPWALKGVPVPRRGIS